MDHVLTTTILKGKGGRGRWKSRGYWAQLCLAGGITGLTSVPAVEGLAHF